MTTKDMLQILITEQTSLKEEVTKLATGQSELKQEVTKLATGQNELKTEVTRLSTEQATLKEGFSKLATGQSELKGELAILREETKDGFRETYERLDKQGKQLAYLEDDAPTREEYDGLVKKVKKIEKALSS